MIECENLVKIYKTKEFEVLALQGLDLTVDDGELMAIIGNSGSGKSTLLNMLGGLDRPTAGLLTVDGKDLLKITPSELVMYKRETVGFVWQNNSRNLIPYLTAAQNIEMPMVFTSQKARKERVLELLDQVGLSKKKDALLQQMSGGEQQRVAIAIALSNKPRLLLADEPTGSVDTKTAKDIMSIFRRLQAEINQTIVIVTHDMQLSRQVSRVVAIRDGKTSSEYRSIDKPLMRPANQVKENDLGKEVLIGSDPALFEPRDPYTIAAKLVDEDDGRFGTHSHQEFSVVDRSGRLQIPQDYLKKLGIEGKGVVRVEYDDGKVVIFPVPDS